MTWGSLLLVIGCFCFALAFVCIRRSVDERSLFRKAKRVTGDVVEVLPGEPSTAKIRYWYQGQDYVVACSPGWDSENNTYYGCYGGVSGVLNG